MARVRTTSGIHESRAHLFFPVIYCVLSFNPLFVRLASDENDYCFSVNREDRIKLLARICRGRFCISHDSAREIYHRWHAGRVVPRDRRDLRDVCYCGKSAQRGARERTENRAMMITRIYSKLRRETSLSDTFLGNLDVSSGVDFTHFEMFRQCDFSP